MEASSEHLQRDADPTTPTLKTSSEFLRFPVPATDARITTWVESINTANMSVRSGEGQFDEGSLGESSYEFIDTDEESRDDNATESVASTDFGRPDDVASLADTEQSGDESGDEDNPVTSSDPVVPGLDHAVEEAFNTPTIGRSSAVFLDEIEKSQAQSIEFEEPFNLGAETVSVKHTVADFDEEKTEQTVKRMQMQNPPKRLAVTIRQTMTKQSLTTRDPLRILYIGSHSAKQDIIHKIASSVTASVENGNRHRLRQSTSQLYNVVPISAFGSERTPEIELMESSGYQIKVEDCTYAQNLKFEGNPDKQDVIKLTLDDNFAYHSVPEGKGFIVEPHWELPHVTIFYCSDSDDIDARRTRTVARKFMSRHGIPSIVISHKQLFERGQCMSLDQHSIHMCLESRDPNGRGNIIHQRLPIDLASFLNIDARQMNRNLAYLTGLHTPLDIKTSPFINKSIEISTTSQDMGKVIFSADVLKSRGTGNGVVTWNMLVRPASLFLLGIFLAVITGIPSYRFSRVPTGPAISVNSKIMSAAPISSTISPSSSSHVPSVTAAPSSLAVETSTRTVTVTQSIALAPGPNSLSVLPSMELGKLPRPANNPVKSTHNKSSVCTAEILGDREILIRIPSATKLSWLSKEAMSVNITRDNIPIDTERAYSTDEGIVLSLSKKEAHGVLNISVITTKKPRVNETFQVDFGTSTSQKIQNLINKLSGLLPDDATLVDPQLFSQVREAAETMAEDAFLKSQEVASLIEQARRVAMEQTASVGASLTDMAKSISLEAVKQSAIITKEFGIQLEQVNSKFSKQMKDFREPFDESLTKAQIQSKLAWLKLQGKTAEYQEYKRRAAEATKRKAEELRRTRKAAADLKKKTNRAAKKAARKQALADKKATKKGRA